MLTAAVLDRRQTSFQLSWPAPMTAAGGTVAGYDIRVALVPITSTNFDDTSMTKALTYTGTTPAAPGHADGSVASGLRVETPYYFAVVGKDGTGTRGTIMATTTAVTAPMLTTVLSGMAGDTAGADVNGVGDFGRPAGSAFTSDGLSDLLVGSNAGTHAYLFFGTSNGYSTTPSVTFTGAVSGFGSSITDAGDIDGDGLDDIAIASPSDGNGKVFIYSRKNPPASWNTTTPITSWPAALTDLQANYVISGTAALMGKMYIRTLARAGNFDGTGFDDLAIGYPLPFAGMGSVFIVKGRSAFASITLPDATNAIEIDGSATMQEFGFRMLDIGQFYPSPAGPTLLVSAAATGDRVFAFKGQSPTGILTDSQSDDSVVSTTNLYGFSLGFLGSVGSSAGAVSIGSTIGNFVDVNFGTAASGPFLGTAGGAPAPSVHFTDSTVGNSFGVINFGSAIAGKTQTSSLIGGDAVPDLVLAGQSEVGQPIYIVDGSALATLPATVDVGTQTGLASPVVKLKGLLPSDWNGFTVGTPIPDSNGDGYPDFAVGESSTGAGRAVVFY
jgi:hypothetical protein